MMGVGLSEMLILFLMMGGSSGADVVSFVPPKHYFETMEVETTFDKMMELATKEGKDGRTQFQQLLAIRHLADEADAFKKSPKYAEQRQILEQIAAGKKANDPQGFAKEQAQKALARFDGKTWTPPAAPVLRDDALAWFPANATFAAAWDGRHTKNMLGANPGALALDFVKMLPPGDVRNCMVALSEDEHLLAQLFQFRFDQGDLEGHSFGNLFVAALSHITGDFAQAVQMSSQILATRGRIYPATNVNVTLAARMDDGSLVSGETNITASPHRIVELMLLPADAEPLPGALDAIANADLITLGPGSLYTSLITNLLVRGIPEAIAASKATRVYVGNLMTQANESLGLTASQHIEKILQHCGRNTAGRDDGLDDCHSEHSEESPHFAYPHIFDYALINTAPISPTLLEQYAREGQTPIEPDLDRIRALGVEPIPGNFVHEGKLLRHDHDRVTDTILKLALAAS